ncbi:DUF502 domain-containing protein [Haloplanus salilacus]|uniref:DUF502 domain-containing protein n=1 Tax=Haloplanus salilacus TaxID=2949994 RepID=UPI0030CE3FD4
MGRSDRSDRPKRSDEFDEYGGPRAFARQAFITGAAVTLPLIVTLLILGVVVDFVSQQLDPVVGVLTSVTGVQPASDAVLKVVAVGALLGAIFGIGAVAERRPDRSGFATFFDTLLARLPGVGSLYRSIDEMSGLLLDSDTDSFQEVKLVEFPVEGSYAFGFLTADTPRVVEEAASHEEMVTLFVPMAPNPVMGGYVLHVSTDHVVDVDLTVEEGIQAIVTSGVATGKRSDEELSEGMLERFERRLDAADTVVGIDELEAYAADASSHLEETVAAARARHVSDGDGDDTPPDEDDGTPDGDGT